MSLRRSLPATAPASEAPIPGAPPPAAVIPATERAGRSNRPEVRGKFLHADGQKLYLRGVTYGPFRPGEDGVPYDRLRAEEDLARLAREGVNTIRLYTLPPRWLLDAAADHGLFVLAGLAWEQHVAFLEDRRRADAIVDRVADVNLAALGAILVWIGLIGLVVSVILSVIGAVRGRRRGSVDDRW